MAIEKHARSSGHTCCSGVLSALCRCASIFRQGILENFLLEPFHKSLCTSCDTSIFSEGRPRIALSLPP